jgi:hypothetical protein
MLKFGKNYRRCWEAGDPSLRPPQFRDYVGLYVYLGKKGGLHCFEGTHWRKGSDSIALTDEETVRCEFELVE